MELRTHEEGECFLKSAEVRWWRGLFSIRPRSPSQRMVFCWEGVSRCLWHWPPLSILAVLTRCPSGCFCCISRCSLGSYSQLSADPAVAPSQAPGFSRCKTYAHLNWRDLVCLGSHIQTDLRGLFGPRACSGSPAQKQVRRLRASTMAPDSRRRDTDAG